MNVSGKNQEINIELKMNALIWSIEKFTEQ